MDSITGVVESVREITTKFGPMQKITLNGNEYGVTGKDAPILSRGDTVTFEPQRTADGRFWNARRLEMAKAGPLPPRIATMVTPALSGKDREGCIMRQSCTGYAATVVASMVTSSMSEENVVALVFRIAFRFNRWCQSEAVWNTLAEIHQLRSDPAEWIA